MKLHLIKKTQTCISLLLMFFIFLIYEIYEISNKLRFSEKFSPQLGLSEIVFYLENYEVFLQKAHSIA